MQQQQRAVSLLLITMVIWGSTFVVTKEIIGEFAPFTLAFLRVAVGSLVLLGCVAVRGRRTTTAGSPTQPVALALPWRDMSIMAFLGVALYYAVFNAALVYTSASQGALVQASIPAMVALVAVLWLREYASTIRWLGIGLSIVGVLIVFSGDSSPAAPSAVLGNLFMFASVVCWGIYTSMAKRVAHFDAVAVTAGVMGVGAIMLLPLAGYEIATQGWPQPTWQGWLGMSYLGAVASGTAYLLYSAALQHIDASHAAVYTNLIPVIGVITGIVVLGEPISMRALLGGAIVLIGVWLTGLQRPSSLSA